MANCGILLVDAGWDDSKLVRFSEAEYRQNQALVDHGAHVLIYERAPVAALTNVAQIAGLFEVFAAAPAAPIETRQRERDFALLLHVLYTQEALHPVTLLNLKKHLSETEFPPAHRSCVGIELALYDRLEALLTT